MGLPFGRLTDVGVGTCCCHSSPDCIDMVGIIVTGSPNVFGNSLGSGRMTDVVLGQCGHTGIIVSGSSNVFSNGLPAARLTSYFTGCFFGTIVTGSGNVSTGG